MKRLKECKGASAVEFALVLIPMILLIFGAIEFGVLLYNQQVITNASREGARAGIVSQSPRVTPTEISTIVNNYADSHLITFGSYNPPVLNPNPPSGYDSNASFGSDLTVTVTYQYAFLVIPNFIPGITSPRTMTATTVMKYE